MIWAMAQCHHKRGGKHHAHPINGTEKGTDKVLLYSYVIIEDQGKQYRVDLEIDTTGELNADGQINGIVTPKDAWDVDSGEPVDIDLDRIMEAMENYQELHIESASCP